LDLIGCDAISRPVLDRIDMIAPADAAVLPQSKTTTGKERIEQAYVERGMNRSSAAALLSDPPSRK
jgi:transcriptional regulator with GAF, ATPase, and Fis domain